MPRVLSVLLLASLASSAACQSPTSPSDVRSASEAVDVGFTPSPLQAAPSGGKTYRVPRDNAPDEILEYDWYTTFDVSVALNDLAGSRDVTLDFPVRLTAVTMAVKQATGGISTPPTSGREYFEYVTVHASGNQLPDMHVPVVLRFDAWYSLPSQRREALVTVTLNLLDAEGRPITKLAEVVVAP